MYPKRVSEQTFPSGPEIDLGWGNRLVFPSAEFKHE